MENIEQQPSFIRRVTTSILGAAKDPLNPATRQHIVLIAFLAWVGLGADGLSSSAYGPEEAFIALGQHAHLGLYLALMTTLTVFLISLSYNQVIELFPNGGGGYKVATHLISPFAGLVSGAALIIDYVLTIAISIAAGADAAFSLIPVHYQFLKLDLEVFFIVALIILNLRGMKESIRFLLPLFLGFFVIHAVLIIYGVSSRLSSVPQLIPQTIHETVSMGHSVGWLATISLLLRAYSLGGGTYTGLEAVSNNVNMLAEPRVKTGKLTMLYMALSLSFVAGGIILLYLLWGAAVVPGKTLNAVVFDNIMHNWSYHHAMLILVLGLEAAMLFVAANTGFLGGPAVLANMAVDGWVPRQFRQLSNRLVTQNGVLCFGLAALAILLWTHGKVAILVVLYSINVFLTFSLSLFGLCVYWWRHRKTNKKWLWRFCLSLIGFSVTALILAVTTVEKFTSGGWMTLLITSVVIVGCLQVKRHYTSVSKQLKKVDDAFSLSINNKSEIDTAPLDTSLPTAVLLVGKNKGSAIHTLLWVQRLFPNVYKNFVFAGVGEIDTEKFASDDLEQDIENELQRKLNYCVRFCQKNNLAATSIMSYAVDEKEELIKLAEEIGAQYPNAVFFASKLIFVNDRWWMRFLHNQTAELLQRQLHLQGKQMVILPMKV